MKAASRMGLLAPSPLQFTFAPRLIICTALRRYADVSSVIFCGHIFL
jgi:hypothetical protein